MKKLIIKLVKTLSVCLCITAIIIPQASQQYTKTIVNGMEKWKLNKQYQSAFDVEESPPQEIDFKYPFHIKLNSSPANFFDERWTLQQPYPTDTYLLAIEADNDFIISTGLGFLTSTFFSDLIISLDRGETWKLHRFGTDSIIISIDKYEDIIWLGGGETTTITGFILKSTDLGKSWEGKLTADSIGVSYVNFFDEDNGVALSPITIPDSTQLKIFHTTDGGDSWTETTHKYKGRTPGFRGLHFLNPDEGWICTEDYTPSDSVRIIQTTDGGLNWNVQLIENITDLGFVEFYNSNTGLAIGQNFDGTYRKLLLYSTSDGGNSWEEQSLIEGDQYGYFKYDMFIEDSISGWLAVSERNVLTLYKSNDGFKTFDSLSTLYNINFLFGEIEFMSETEGWLTSDLGVIYYTSDGGDSWVPKHKSATTAYLNSLDFIDENLGWAAGKDNVNNEDLIIKSNNGGVDWEVVFSDSNADYIDMAFISEQRGFIISDNSPNCSINRTDDGGINWNPTQFVFTELNSIKFTDANNGWAVGRYGSGLFITHTSDSGESWVQQDSINLLANSLTNVDFADKDFGFAIGEDGVIIKTTDGGTYWETSWGNLDPNLFWFNYDLTGVYFPEPLTCWVSGYRSISGGYETMVVKTTDGGANWDTLSFSSDYNRSGDIFFINGFNGFIVGNYYDYKTTDGGLTWSQIEYPSNINKMFFLNEGLGWAIGNYGRIFKYIDPSVGFEGRKNLQFPNNYTLFQNYPNPFNPSTKISWQVPVGSQQTLKIFDVLGNEVATLVDDYKPAGSYEVEWDASGLPSGIYFYQLKTDNYIETKKMLLLK